MLGRCFWSETSLHPWSSAFKALHEYHLIIATCAFWLIPKLFLRQFVLYPNTSFSLIPSLKRFKLCLADYLFLLSFLINVQTRKWAEVRKIRKDKFTHVNLDKVGKMQIYLWILEIRLISENNEFPGSLVVGTQHFYCWGLGSTRGQATEIPQAMWHGQNNNNNIKINNKCISEAT